MTIPRTFSAADIIDRGEVSRRDLIRFILHHGLIAYDSDSLQRIDVEYQKYIIRRAQQSDDYIETIIDGFDHSEHGVYCKEDDLIAFVEKHPGSINLRALSIQHGNDSNPPAQKEEKNHDSDFFHKNHDGTWHIRFKDEEATVMPLLGLQIIAYLIGNTDMVSCRELYNAAKGTLPGNTVSEGTAIDEGLYTGYTTQAVNTPEVKTKYLQRLMELSDRLLSINDKPDHEKTPEDEMEKKELEKEIAVIEASLKEGNFGASDEKKVQSNVYKRLKGAYGALEKAKMKKLAKHLRDKITPNGKFGLQYSDANVWDVEIR